MGIEEGGIIITSHSVLTRNTQFTLISILLQLQLKLRSFNHSSTYRQPPLRSPSDRSCSIEHDTRKTSTNSISINLEPTARGGTAIISLYSF